MIPNILHFVFGMAPDFGGKPFSLVHYLSVKSAVDLNLPEQAILHYQYEPSGEWWQRAKPLLTLHQITAPEHFMGRPLIHTAHKADVVRLQALNEMGGIYLDLDTISVQPLTSLLAHQFVIGQELKNEYVPKNWRQKIKYKLGITGRKETNQPGLCNAVLLSEKGSAFIGHWLNGYQNFRSRGRDKYWNEHSVKLPQQLASLFPELITPIGPYAFHYPLYDTEGLRSMFEEVHEFPDAYLHHLWESFSWNNYLSKLTVEDIRNRDTTYNRIARRFLL